EVSITLIVREKLKNTNYNQRYIALVQTIDNKDYSGRILVSIPKKNIPNPFEVGTILRIQGTLVKNKKPDNPNQFDYGNYLKQKQIYAQLYVHSGNIERSLEPQKDIWYYS